MNNATLNKSGRITHGREVLACLLLLIGIYFLRQQRHQLPMTLLYLHRANSFWLMLALLVTAVFIFLQSYMYVKSFSAVGARLDLAKSTELFLKRNLIGIFLPGGGLTALAYIPGSVQKNQEKGTVYRASAVFAFAGLLSTFFIASPLVVMNVHGKGTVGWGITVALILLLSGLFKTFKKRGRLYGALNKRFPALGRRIYDFAGTAVNQHDLYAAIGTSVGVEVCGIVHLYLSMLAVGASPSLQAAAGAYIVSVLLIVASPFLKGLGAIELSIVYILSQYGYTPSQALAITILYRFFEFWLPLFCGIIAFLLKGKDIFLRVFPALLIFTLGLINILSVVTPPLTDRIHLIRFFVPVAALHVTNLIVLYIGLVLLVTAAYLIKGRRNAWRIAILISFLSVPGHLIKALDYEEALAALLVFTSLVFTKNQYRTRGNPARVRTGLAVTFLGFVAVLAYGFMGFYFLEQKHFGLDFSWQQSLLNSVRGFFLLNPEHLPPLTRFGKEFLRSLHFAGLLAWSFLLYSLVWPRLQTRPVSAFAKDRARDLLNQYGSSPVDYFKLGDEMLLFLSHAARGFVSYRVAGNFAIALEVPVCAPENKRTLLKEFDFFCHNKGLKTVYYRVDQDDLQDFGQLKKKKFIIGQEALLDITSFDLTGRTRKSLRNSLNSLQKKGFTTCVHEAPQCGSLLAQLKRVSDNWLQGVKRKELVFAQGGFDTRALRYQDVVVCMDAKGTVVAFLNIIPDFALLECTYDMIRKTQLAPGGCMDALIVALIDYTRKKNLRYLNLGLVPFSGIIQPANPAERVMQLAYNRIKRFSHYRGLREFKEKYATAWRNKYLVYENDFDLLQLPRALNQVMQKAPPKLVAI